MRTRFFEKARFRCAAAGLVVAALSLASVSGCGIARKKGGAAGGEVAGDAARILDQQAEALAKIEGARTQRVGDGIKVTWDSAQLFELDSAMLRPDVQAKVKEMADVFGRYRDTDIVITGHTDSTGSDEYNRTLSERRALALQKCFVDMGVAPSRLKIVGYGESLAAASNDTEEGRRMNRRMEIVIRSRGEVKSHGTDANPQD